MDKAFHLLRGFPLSSLAYGNRAGDNKTRDLLHCARVGARSRGRAVERASGRVVPRWSRAKPTALLT